MIEKKLSGLELSIILEGNVKIVKELQEETKKDYPEVVKRAIQNELQERYNWHETLSNEMSLRSDKVKTMNFAEALKLYESGKIIESLETGRTFKKGWEKSEDLEVSNSQSFDPDEIRGEWVLDASELEG